MAATEPASSPNIVLILTDQQRFDTIRALGFDHVDTPNLDRLVNEGTSFNRCYVTAPSCAPSRASLFTGLYPHTCGVLKNMDRWEHSWVERLNEGGYHCANIGKMHSCPFETPMGFHERFVVENKDRYLEGREFQDQWDRIFTARGQRKQQRELYRLRDDYRESLGAFLWEMGEDTHSDNFVGNAASRWIKNYEQPKPFFLQVGFPGPPPPPPPPPPVLPINMPIGTFPSIRSPKTISRTNRRRSKTCANTIVKSITIPWCIRRPPPRRLACANANTTWLTSA